MKPSIQIEVLGNKFDTRFPNIGEIMKIENLKHSMSDGTYNNMVKTNTVSSRFNSDLVDALSTFTVIFPKFTKKLGKKAGGNMFDLPAIQSKEIVKVYRDTFYPWYEDFLKELYSEVEEEEKEKSKNA